MSMTVSVHEAKSGLSKLLAQVAKDGAPIVICNRGKPVAVGVPVVTENPVFPEYGVRVMM